MRALGYAALAGLPILILSSCLLPSFENVPAASGGAGSGGMSGDAGTDAGGDAGQAGEAGGGTVPPVPVDDVFTMLQQNRAVEQKNGKDVVEIREVKSRRKRDYWLILMGGNLLILGLVALTRFNSISLIYGFSGVIILSLSLTWVMWFVMDDY